MSDILHTKRRISPRVVEEIYDFLNAQPHLLGRDKIGLLVLTLGRASQKQLFKDENIKVPTSDDFLASAHVACTAVVDFLKPAPWSGVRPSEIWGARSDTIQRAQEGFENWSRECDEAWKDHASGKDVGSRWEKVFAIRELIFTNVYPRKLEQFPCAAREALERLDELSDSDDEETTEAETHTALYEIHDHLVMQKGGSGLFVGTADGQLRLGWRQSRDSLAESRKINRRERRRRRKHRHVEHVEKAQEAQDAVDAADTAWQVEIDEAVVEHVRQSLPEAVDGTARWHVLQSLRALLRDETTIPALSSLTGMSASTLREAYVKERKRLARISREA